MSFRRFFRPKPYRVDGRMLVIALLSTLLVTIGITSVVDGSADGVRATTQQVEPGTVNVPMKIGDTFAIVHTNGAATMTLPETVTSSGMQRQADPTITLKGNPTVDSLNDAATLAAQYLGKPASATAGDYTAAHNAIFQLTYGGSAALKQNQLACIQALGSMMTDAGVLAAHSSILDTAFTNGNVDLVCHSDTGYDTEQGTLNKPFDPTIGK